MARGAPPLLPGDLVVSDYRATPFYKGETLIVDEIKNVGTRGQPLLACAPAEPAWRERLARRHESRALVTGLRLEPTPARA